MVVREVGDWASIACTTSKSEVMQGVAVLVVHPGVFDEADENAQNWEQEF